MVKVFKISCLAAATVLLSITASAQKEITIEELDKHVGDSVTVCTKIYGGIFLDRNKDSLTLLNAGGVYPNAPLTLVVRINTRKNFREAPELFYKGKDVCISGKIVLYRDKPQIELYDEKQILVK